jgi:hypothetical protein
LKLLNAIAADFFAGQANLASKLVRGAVKGVNTMQWKP